ncbi:acyl-CoA thioesterase II [Carbonactinospora thermoautotrophica]|uniref:Acyl-CoA thioesterase 2 n=1 Tax=Carbonactinospora thermoautotrophica TaxID=1469144 RepID=A0A132MJL8_9ACTN|nr:acyl-CoA thioesterase II [Carbonactinospora thermoautotrophica]KWW98026.1 acyl-CoA thioesterase [Carbonactinospora thermoautotrophica]KWX03034.1 Acyl-CoA thioesterase II [Carbonactinospora thermoautotrophica]KWX09776.1 acyl-CoA thioesterase [Carbonactinospora thermoautotrophica]MCX9193228.1 acyl-CoA thioesterase II [Carbonactinospora thermoautotrophica]
MTPLDELLEILDLDEVGADVYRGQSPQEDLQRVFGGQVAGQALVAAGRTVPEDRPVHSLHAYFLRPGDPTVPIEYAVERLRDGRSFTARRVVARQRGKAILTLAASFQLPAEGLDHQTPMPVVPEPETLPTLAERVAPYRDKLPAWWSRERPIDVRHVGDPPYLGGADGPREPRQYVWMRAAGKLPDDPMLHACVIAYASDMTLLDSVLLAHGETWHSGRLKAASLDHAMWFHRPARADEWMLYVQESPSASGARGFTRAQIYTWDGKLAVSVAQEGMIRLVEPRDR